MLKYISLFGRKGVSEQFESIFAVHNTVDVKISTTKNSYCV